MFLKPKAFGIWALFVCGEKIIVGLEVAKC